MEDDDIFKCFDELDENKIDINYKDSLLANLFSQIDFLRNEIKELYHQKSPGTYQNK